MGVAVMIVVVPRGMVVAVPVRVAMGMGWIMDVHGQGPLYEFAGRSAAPREVWLLESMTTELSEFVDGGGIHCQHQKWVRVTGKPLCRADAGSQAEGNEQSNRQTEFLGSAWIDAYG